ncbi:MAG: hypothetical protein M0Q53_08740 [Prolixibacteraceae bacterium]|jgi:hypothetical protein|nr:hypothetical protein [Prolixibacteraceae bacterium]
MGFSRSWEDSVDALLHRVVSLVELIRSIRDQYVVLPSAGIEIDSIYYKPRQYRAGDLNRKPVYIVMVYRRRDNFARSLNQIGRLKLKLGQHFLFDFLGLGKGGLHTDQNEEIIQV